MNPDYPFPDDIWLTSLEKFIPKCIKKFEILNKEETAEAVFEEWIKHRCYLDLEDPYFELFSLEEIESLNQTIDKDRMIPIINFRLNIIKQS